MNGIDRFYDLSGLWEADIGDGRIYPMRLPGTLDENCIGHKDICGKAVHPDETLGGREKESAPEDGGAEASDSARLECPDAPIATRFTRRYTYEGAARFTRSFTFGAPAGKRVFLEGNSDSWGTCFLERVQSRRSSYECVLLRLPVSGLVFSWWETDTSLLMNLLKYHLGDMT